MRPVWLTRRLGLTEVCKPPTLAVAMKLLELAGMLTRPELTEMEKLLHLAMMCMPP